jgi:hypothetical protein
VPLRQSDQGFAAHIVVCVVQVLPQLGANLRSVRRLKRTKAERRPIAHGIVRIRCEVQERFDGRRLVIHAQRHRDIPAKPTVSM